MMKPLLSNEFLMSFGSVTAVSFVFTVKTDNTGTSNNDQFTIPLYAGETYNFTVAYDGQETTHNTDSDLTLTFPSGAGTYEVVITGTFAGIFFNNGGDRLKITDVASFGDIGWCRLDGAFRSCSNIVNFPTTIPNNVNITTLSSTWRACTSATSLPNVNNLTSVNTLENAWFGCSSATAFPEVSSLVLVTTLSGAWRSCASASTFPSVATLTEVTTLLFAWLSCSGATVVPILPSASTALTTCASAMQSIGSGMGGTVEELWNATNFPNIVSFADCFTGATGLTNYADIPDSWKGL